MCFDEWSYWFPSMVIWELLCGVWDVPKRKYHWKLIGPFVNVPNFIQKLMYTHLHIVLFPNQTLVGAWGPWLVPPTKLRRGKIAYSNHSRKLVGTGTSPLKFVDSWKRSFHPNRGFATSIQMGRGAVGMVLALRLTILKLTVEMFVYDHMGNAFTMPRWDKYMRTQNFNMDVHH